MSDIKRGEVISLIAGLPLAVLATTAIASADDSGGTKAQYKYVDKSAKAGQECDGCALYKAPNACQVVHGKINPKGWCTLYAAKPK
jgi:hypothetical protein